MLYVNPSIEWLERGIDYAMAGYHDEALYFFDRALRFDPQHADALHFKALSLQALGRSEEALGCLEQATQAEPESPNLWKARGEMLANHGHVALANHCFAEAARLAPGFYGQYN
jgi:tetratricopeptide (TPR) repeat protein